MRKQRRRAVIVFIITLLLVAALLLAWGVGSDWGKNPDMTTWFNNWGRADGVYNVAGNVPERTDIDGGMLHGGNYIEPEIDSEVNYVLDVPGVTGELEYTAENTAVITLYIDSDQRATANVIYPVYLNPEDGEIYELDFQVCYTGVMTFTLTKGRVGEGYYGFYVQSVSSGENGLNACSDYGELIEFEVYF